MVDSGFTRKKVASLTLGEKLRKLRGDVHLNLPEISKATKIQIKYLEYLENGQYDKLPADVYVRGFLRSYARYFNLDENAFVRLYERERNIRANLGHEESNPKYPKNFDISSIVVTPRSVVMVLIVLSVASAFFYLYREFQNFAAAPRLVILEPQNGARLETNEVTVHGKTDKGARLSINNQSVFVGGDGEFSEKLILQPGLNSITVVSVNRFDKEKRESVSVETNYVPSQPEGNSGMAAREVAEKFRLDLEVREKPLRVIVEADGAVVFSGSLPAGENKAFEASGTIKVTSEDGSKTFVRFDDGEAKPLSEKKGSVKDVVFDKDGRQG